MPDVDLRESITPPAFVDDPAWVLARYREAREIIYELSVTAGLPEDLRAAVDEWCSHTAFDTCTTMGKDCRCNEPAREALEGPADA